jgi:lipopolysaccharide export system protein LptA
MKASLSRALLGAWLALASGPGLALSTDKDQPIEIEADFAELDDQRGVTVYKGNVVVTQGSLRLTGDLLTVNYDDDQQLQNVFLDGRPARFRQTSEKGEVTNGRGRRVEYHNKESLLILVNDAWLEQAGKQLSGHRISYDTERSVLTARAAPGSPQPAPGQTRTDRIKVIIPPKKKSESATPSAGGAPAAEPAATPPSE